MSGRFDYEVVAPAANEAMRGVERYVRGSGLERSLLELVKIRASQLNGCAFCLDMHTKDARAAGESEQRIYVLPAWREAPFYSERERAALAWTEALTRLGSGGVPDELYDQARKVFNEVELVNLTMAIVAINGWNRLSVAFRSPEPGSYTPPA
ncbi:MAG TPA: carboxymuconolactone decarboxylase family protein [Gemmatimonadaceae bacterium]|jgi:AhpD family alkylhydroperoxidase|nr:carboxymuconolactone decarboxylase family protein [Gemmatimonadaceae bacterium]